MGKEQSGLVQNILSDYWKSKYLGWSKSLLWRAMNVDFNTMACDIRQAMVRKSNGSKEKIYQSIWIEYKVTESCYRVPNQLLYRTKFWKIKAKVKIFYRELEIIKSDIVDLKK